MCVQHVVVCSASLSTFRCRSSCNAFDKKLVPSNVEPTPPPPPPPTESRALQIEGDSEVTPQQDKRSVELASAAGAFVHGLEDEFAAVRGAAVESITKLALHRPLRELAERATTNLVDAFNDEIESVRLRAVLGVRRILNATRSSAASEPLALSEDYVIVALSNLEEASEQIREAIRALLCSVRLESAQSLRAIVQSLMANMSKHPEDTPSVLQCLRRLGRGHAEFAELLIEKLLHIDRRFAPQEPHIDDLYYACIMVLLINAAVRRPTILARLPSYCAGHAAYLRLRFGALMPTVACAHQRRRTAWRECADAASRCTMAEPTTSMRMVASAPMRRRRLPRWRARRSPP
jgi:hypothetical protein